MLKRKRKSLRAVLDAHTAVKRKPADMTAFILADRYAPSWDMP